MISGPSLPTEFAGPAAGHLPWRPRAGRVPDRPSRPQPHPAGRGVMFRGPAGVNPSGGTLIEMSGPDKDRRGFRYEVDRAAQEFGPLRVIEAWALRHPIVNAVSFVFLGAFFAVLFSLVLHSWPEGIAVGAAIAVVSVFTTRANHRRRVKNKTSAEYGPPHNKRN